MIKTFRYIYKKSLKESWGGDYSNQFENILEQEVPRSGAAKTMYGEVIRAVNRICWRYWNDGDLFWKDYGIETCGDAAYFLLNYAPDEIKNLILEMEYVDEDKYDNLCDELIKLAVNIDLENKNKLKAQQAMDHQNYRLSKEVIYRWGDPDENQRCPECGEYYESCECGICTYCGLSEDRCTCYKESE